MDTTLLALLALALGALGGFFIGVRFAGDQIGRQLKADLAAGRLTKADAIRIAEMPDAKRRDA